LSVASPPDKGRRPKGIAVAVSPIAERTAPADDILNHAGIRDAA